MFSKLAEILLTRKFAGAQVDKRFIAPHVQGSYLLELAVKDSNKGNGCVVEALLADHLEARYAHYDRVCVGLFPQSMKEAIAAFSERQIVSAKKDNLLTILAETTGILPILPAKSNPNRSLASKLNDREIIALKNIAAQLAHQKEAPLTPKIISNKPTPSCQP